MSYSFYTFHRYHISVCTFGSVSGCLIISRILLFPKQGSYICCNPRGIYISRPLSNREVLSVNLHRRLSFSSFHSFHKFAGFEEACEIMMILHGLSTMSGLASNPANRQIVLSSGGVGAPRYFFPRFFYFFFKKLEKNQVF